MPGDVAVTNPGIGCVGCGFTKSGFGCGFPPKGLTALMMSEGLRSALGEAAMWEPSPLWSRELPSATAAPVSDRCLFLSL